MGEALAMGLLLIDSVAHGLVADLGHPRFQKRQTATVAIRSMAPMAVSHLEKARKHADPEVAIRADRLVSEYYATRAEFLAPKIRPTAYPCLPWIDMLPSDHPSREIIIRAYLVRASSGQPRQNSKGWPTYRRATMILVRDQLAEGRPRVVVIQLLDRMVIKEKVWIGKNSHNPNIPAQLKGK